MHGQIRDTHADGPWVFIVHETLTEKIVPIVN